MTRRTAPNAVPARSRRRRFLAALAAVVPALLAPSRRAVAQGMPAPLAPTPPDAEGPFYPSRMPAEQDSDLTVVAGRANAAQGTRLYLSGRVLDTRGQPMPGARIELWQCDATGHYHHVDGDRPGDPGFQGYGVVIADDAGRWRLKTIRPVAYGSRPPHLHFKLSHPSAAPLTTQLYVRGDDDSRDPLARAGGARSRDRLAIAPSPLAGAEPGALQAQYDFVLVARAG